MKAIFTIIICLFYGVAYTQVYNSKKASKGYGQFGICELKLSKDSSVIIVLHDSANLNYVEYLGRIEKVDDTLFHIWAISRFWVFNSFISHDSISVCDYRNFVDYNVVTIRYGTDYVATNDLSKIKTRTEMQDDLTAKGCWSAALDWNHIKFDEEIDPVTGSAFRKIKTNIGIDIGHKNPVDSNVEVYPIGQGCIEIQYSKREQDFYLVFHTNETKMMRKLLRDEKRQLFAEYFDGYRQYDPDFAVENIDEYILTKDNK